MMPLLLYLLLLGSFHVSAQTAGDTSASCSDAYKFQPGSAMKTNVLQVLDVLRQNASKTRYSIYSTQESGSEQAYGLLDCRGDVSLQECSTCVSTAIGLLNGTCLRNSTQGGRVHLEKCFVRYEDHFFASTLDDAPMKSNCSQGNGTEEFRRNAKLAMAYLKDKVPQNDTKFLVIVAGLRSRVFALGQCVRNLNIADCRSCISNAEDALLQTCPGAVGAACSSATCQVAYASFKFFSGDPVNATALMMAEGSSSRSKAVAIGVAAAGGAILLLAAALLAIYVRKRKGTKKSTELQDTLHRGPVTFSYDMLKNCTGNFDESHKLGEGGFGAVYKGFFVDGTEIAIKRLSVTTKQGEQQFLNEVKVISSVQHRNLVKLHRCCVRGSERLLVYEFCKNNSLDKALFEKPKDSAPLTWETRFNVLLGTARGLSYLHEDSQVRIVHRDIKPSNILLDENFEAKIADFGLARLCTEDEVSNIVTTKVAGTYGYMAPEYAFHGELSEKADVFSFGIVILEAVSGTRNRYQLLAQQAWELHAAGGGEKLDQLFDPDMVVDNAPRVREVIGIALMCSQGSAQARPSMSHVVAMLAGHSNVYVPKEADLKPYSSSSSSLLDVASIGETPSSAGTANEQSIVQPR